MKKYCYKCKEYKSTGDFYKNRSKSDGLSPECKLCCSTENKRRYWKNPEESRKRTRKQMRADYCVVLERAKIWQKENPEKAKERVSKWNKSHPEHSVARSHNYRARKRNAGGKITAGEWKALKDFYGSMCLDCGQIEPRIKLTADHVIPLSKGGTNTIDNIQPLCLSCNDRKGTKHIDFRLKFVGYIEV